MRRKLQALELPCGVCGGSYEVPLGWIETAHSALRTGCPGTDLQACPYFAFGDLIPQGTFGRATDMMEEIGRIARTLNGRVVTER